MRQVPVIKQCVFISVFLTLLTSAALADTETSGGERSGEGTTAFTGLAQAPEANLFTGSLGTGISIKVPPGRKHMTPKLVVAYSSSGGPSPYGKGWDLPLGQIERSTRWGVPHCASPHFDEFVLVLPGGVAAELVEEPAGSNKYRPRVEQSYTYAEYHPSTNSWSARDAAGIKYKFGTTADSKLATTDVGNPPREQMNGGHCDFTTAWALTKMEDANGNTIDITWEYKPETGNYLLPDRIDYGGSVNGSLAHFHWVEFDWVFHGSGVGSSTATYRRGVKQELVKRLFKIRPGTTKTGGGMPEYTFSGTGTGNRYLLTTVSANDLPPQNFFYSGWDGEGHFAAPVVVNAPTTPEAFNRVRRWSPTGDVFKTLIDMNGDGLLDLVDDNSFAPWKVHFASLGTIPDMRYQFGAATNWSSPSDLVREVLIEGCDNAEACTAKDTFDITGDGIPDYVDATTIPYWTVYRGRYANGWGFAQPGSQWAAPITMTRKLDHEDTYQDVIDMTGDGLPDLVISGGNGVPAGKWLVYRNTGSGFDLVAMDFAVPDDDIRQITRATSSGVTQTMLTDFNGDGLPDLLTTIDYDDVLDNFWEDPPNHFNYPSQFLLYLNTGQRFSDDPVVVDAGQSKLPYSDDRHTQRDVLDMNGDGLPDMVANIDDEEWRVSLNVGGELEEHEWYTDWAPNQHYRRSPRVWPGVAGDIRWTDNDSQIIDMVDLNGDGFLDRVKALSTGWEVQLNLQTVKPDLLVMMENGLGGTNTIKYEPSTRFDHLDNVSGAPTLPFVNWVVTGTRLNDGFCVLAAGRDPFETNLSKPNHNNCVAQGSELITKMHYEDGLFAYEVGPGGKIFREFRGFRKVKQTDVFGNETITHFEQGLYTKGLVSSVGYRLGALSLVRYELNDWDTAPFAWSTRTQLWLARNVRDQYDGGATPLSITTVNERPDPAGNVTHTYTYGTNIPHRVHSKTEFVLPTAESPRDKPQRTYTWEDFDNDGVVDLSLGSPDQYGRTTELLEEKKFYYDAQGYGTMLKGNLTKVSSRLKDDNGDTWIDSTTTYDSYGNIVGVTDAKGRSTQTSYNADGKGAYLYPTQETNALLHITLKQYDYRHGKVIRIDDPNGPATARAFAYDKLGRPVVYLQPGDNIWSPSVLYSYSFPTATPGQVAAPSVMTVDTRQDGFSTHRSVKTYFDALGRQRYQVSPRVVNGTLSNVTTNKVDFDYSGNVARKYQPYVGSVPGGYTQYAYHFNGNADLIDPLGRVHKVIAPNGTTMALNFYDRASTLTIGSEGELGVSRRDAMGREIQRDTYHRPPPGTSHQLLATSETIHDGLGRIVAVYQNRSAANHPIKTMRYDTMGRKIETRDRDSGTWFYGYDVLGNLSWQDDPKTSQHLEFCYDKLNRMELKCAFPSDFSGTPMTCSLGGTTCPSGLNAIAVYHKFDQPGVPYSIGRPTKTVDQAGETRILGYDARGRQTGMVRRIVHGGNAGEAEFQFVYNRNDEVVEIEYPDGEVVQTDYDESGQPKRLANTDGYHYVEDARYDKFGRLTRLDRSISSGPGVMTDEATFGGVATNFRLADLRLATGAGGGGGPTLQQEYTHNARGQVTGILDLTGVGWIASGKPNVSNGASFAYDDLGRLVSFDPVPAPLPTQTYQYDAWGNITKKGAVEIAYPNPTVAANGPHKTNQVKVGGSFYNPQHDANGNRNLTFASGTLTGEASYDREDRVASIGLGGGDSVSFVYDAGGQQKIKIFTDGAGSEVTKYYSPQIEVRPDGSTIKSYYFGGTRVASVVESGSGWQTAANTWESPVQLATHWGGAPVLLATVSQGAVTAACWASALLAVALFLLPPGRRRHAVVGMRLQRGPAILLAIVIFSGTMPWPLLIQPASAQPPSPAPGDVRYFHYDHIGSPLLITNGAGQVVEHIRYDPYGAVRGRYNGAGNSISEPLATDVRYEFTGYEAERNSGLLYANARFFDTELGTFLTHDPMAEFWNPYSYVGWDPVNGTDPTGMDFGISTLILAFVVGFAASAISAAIQGASFGDALLAGLVGGATAVVGATIGALVLQPALAGMLNGVAGSLGASAEGLASAVLFVSGIGQASYSASQGDYGGLIGLGLGLAVGGLARGAQGSRPVSTAKQLWLAEKNYGQRFNWTTLEYYQRPTALGLGVGTHGVAYLPNPDPSAPGKIVEGRATIGGDTWGETINNVSAQVGNGAPAGNITATLTDGYRSNIFANGYQLIDTVQVPGTFAHAAAAANDYVSAVQGSGLAYNPLPFLGGANSNTVIYSLAPAIGGPIVSPHWRAVGGARSVDF